MVYGNTYLSLAICIMTLPKLIVFIAISLVLPGIAAEPKSKPKKPSEASVSGKKGAASEKSKDEGGAEKIVADLTPAQSKKLLDLLNTGDDEALKSLPGVGAARAAAIKKGRPFKTVAAVTTVDGVGEGALKEWVKHAKSGFPVESAPKKAEAPTKKKAPSKSKDKAKDKAGS